ncbi:MAG: hypothetical protein CMJ46_06665, partial [Planctomyces sp.]|nr:hypothetical protein [Planctomyces sp.]
MDLRFCPECKQSVLDEDATECPFCGASMSGDAPAKAKPAAPAKKRGLTPRSDAKTPPKSAAKSDPSLAQQRKATPEKVGTGASQPGFLKQFGGAAAPGSDEEIFNFDTSKIHNAFQLRPKPQRGCTYRVTCPMCETSGFAPHSKAGRDVRCRNKDCICPVFVAPKVGGDQRKTVDEGKQAHPVMVVSIATLLVVALGGGVIWWLSRVPKTDPLSQPNASLAMNPETGQPESEGTTTPTDNNPETEIDPLQEILNEIETRRARNVENYTLNRDPALCLKLSAEIHALTGQTKPMNE